MKNWRRNDGQKKKKKKKALQETANFDEAVDWFVKRVYLQLQKSGRVAAEGWLELIQTELVELS